MSLATNIGSAVFATLPNYLTSRGHDDQNQFRSPAQPKSFFFVPIWNTIYAGLNVFSLRSSRPEYAKAQNWYRANCILNGLSAYLAKQENKKLDLINDLGILGTAVGYRMQLPSGELKGLDQFIRWSAELYVGWMAAANVLVGSQLIRQRKNWLGTEKVQARTNGLASIAGLTAAGVAVERTVAWKGALAAIAWGMTGAAIEKRNSGAVRTAAGIGALYFLYSTIKSDQPYVVRPKRDHHHAVTPFAAI